MFVCVCECVRTRVCISISFIARLVAQRLGVKSSFHVQRQLLYFIEVYFDLGSALAT